MSTPKEQAASESDSLLSRATRIVLDSANWKMQALKVSNSLLDAEKTTLKKFEKVVGKIDWSEAAEALLDVGPVKSAAYPSEIIDYLNVYTDAMSDMG